MMNDSSVYQPLLTNSGNDCEIDIVTINSNNNDKSLPCEELCSTFILAHLDEITANIKSEEWLINKLFIEGNFQSFNIVNDHCNALLKAKKLLIKLQKELPGNKKNSNNSMVINSSMIKINNLLDKLRLLHPIRLELIEQYNKTINSQHNLIPIFFFLMSFLIIIITLCLVFCCILYFNKL